MSDEKPVEYVDVEVEFVSPVLGRERGAREVLTRSPFLDDVIAEGHVRVVREVGAPSAALVGVPAPPSLDDDAQARLERNPDVIAAVQRAEQALADGEAVAIEVPAPESAPRKGRGGSR